MQGLFGKHGSLFKSVCDAKVLRAKDKSQMCGKALSWIDTETTCELLANDAIQCKYALQHWKDTCRNDILYACPSSPFLQTLNDVLSGCLLWRPSPESASGVVDDSDFLPALSNFVSESSTNQIVFRVMHKNPHSQKLIDSVSSFLRNDHVAVAMYNVTGFSVDNSPQGGPCMTATGAMDASSKIVLMSLDTFAHITMPILKERMFACKEDALPRYTLLVGRGPADVDPNLASFCINRLVDAEAYPGPCKVMYAVDGDDHHFFSCLDALSDLQIVTTMPGPSWQLTSKGLSLMQQCRVVSQFQKVFHVRFCHANSHLCRNITKIMPRPMPTSPMMNTQPIVQCFRQYIHSCWVLDKNHRFYAFDSLLVSSLLEILEMSELSMP